MTKSELTSLMVEILSPETPLGFGEPPRPRYIYANRQYPDCLWYFWNGSKSEYEPIGYHALTGLVEKIEIKTKEFKGKTEAKLNVHVKADRHYIIESGLDTLFAKGLLYTLSKIPAESFAKPITIAVEAGETDQVLFCRIYNPVTGNSVYAPYPEQVDWVVVADRVIQKIGGGVAPAEPQLPALPVAPRRPPLDNPGDWDNPMPKPATKAKAKPAAAPVAELDEYTAEYVPEIDKDSNVIPF
jgi:hypothetical protein